MRRFEFRDGTSEKFWEIDRDGPSVTTRWGRIGTNGQSKTKDFGTDTKAEAAVVSQVTAKTAKGYAEAGAHEVVTASAPADPAPAWPDGPSNLDDGGRATVPGSGGRAYTLRHVGGVYSCSCPAWRNQSEPIERRTCKHLRRFRGEEAETARLGSLPAPARTAGAKADAPPVLLAQRFDPERHDPAGWWMSEKLDGVRAWWDGTRFLSRLGNPFLAPDWFTEGLPEHPLDGELFAGRGGFPRAVSIARRSDGSRHWEELSYVVFDGPEVEGPFEDRLAQLRALEQAGAWRFARVLPHTPCDGHDALQAELTRVEALGGEGLMLRQPGSRYVQGRSDTLLKVKSFHDAEARVVGHVAGSGRHTGRVGALRAVLPDGTAFKVGTGFTDAQRADPPPIGAVITVRYQELTEAGVPRFPTFVGVRLDLDWDAVVHEPGT